MTTQILLMFKFQKSEVECQLHSVLFLFGKCKFQLHVCICFTSSLLLNTMLKYMVEGGMLKWILNMLDTARP